MLLYSRVEYNSGGIIIERHSIKIMPSYFSNVEGGRLVVWSPTYHLQLAHLHTCTLATFHLPLKIPYMLIATCLIKLELRGVSSLKEKRRIVKSITARLPQKFNVAVAEVEAQDVWQTAVIALATVGTDAGYLHGLLEKAVAWIDHTRPDAPISDYTIELF